MEEVTREDREKELKFLLDQMQQHPERDWSKERARVTVLKQVLGLEAAHHEG